MKIMICFERMKFQSELDEAKFYLKTIYAICFVLVAIQFQIQIANTENNSNFIDPHIFPNAHTEQLQQTGQAYFIP